MEPPKPPEDPNKAKGYQDPGLLVHMRSAVAPQPPSTNLSVLPPGADPHHRMVQQQAVHGISLPQAHHHPQPHHHMHPPQQPPQHQAPPPQHQPPGMPQHAMVEGDTSMQTDPNAEGKKKSKNSKHRRRNRWTPMEEAALQEGVRKYGSFANCWAKIKADVELRETLSKRSNVDLKDKWRNTKNQSTKQSRKPKTLDELNPEAHESGLKLPYETYRRAVVTEMLKNRAIIQKTAAELHQNAVRIEERPGYIIVPESSLSTLLGVVESVDKALEAVANDELLQASSVPMAAPAHMVPQVMQSAPMQAAPAVPPGVTGPTQPTIPVGAASAADELKRKAAYVQQHPQEDMMGAKKTRRV